MDPFAALGAAAAIAQFIEQGIKLVNGAREIHKSAFGATAENKRLGTVIQELKVMSERLVSKRALDEQSEAEKSLSEVALECQILSEKILQLLEKTKAKDRNSLRQSAVAALKSAWNESEKKELVDQVETCRNMMHTQLTVILGLAASSLGSDIHELINGYRSSTVLRLDSLIKTGKCNADELSSLRKNVDALRFGVKLTEIGPGVEQQLRKLLSISDTAMNTVTKYRILNSLAFNEMHRRFDSVAKANHGTFEWILDKESKKTRPGQELTEKGRKTLEKRALFRWWLQTGTEIFHIAGKLGSGKSTLMKFLCDDPRSSSLLDMWATGRQLVIAKFFFWKPGTEMENSLNGMIRTLLYDVLKLCPDLIPLVFPDQWDEVQNLPWQATITLRLNSDEINNAFRRLIDSRNSGRPRCFCFFIDGLDEFRGTGGRDYGDLVDTLASWTQCTREDPQRSDDIKLCVSSREENVFTERFSQVRRLRLQDLNRIDLEAFVKERLTSHKLFSTLEYTKDTTQEQFIGQIADEADGVFLWAALVMITLREGLDNGDALSELQRKLHTSSSDIEELFGDLIVKIHKSDRQQAARTFSMLSAIRKYGQGDRMALFAYSFLDEFDKDSQFAFGLPIGPRIGDEEISQRLSKASKQLIGRCRGLVEIRERIPWGGDPPFLITALQHEITVVHRSIHEFLEIPENHKWMGPYLENFSSIETLCQLTIAMMKRLGPIQGVAVPGKAHDIGAMNFHSIFLQTLRCLRGISSEMAIQSKVISCLGSLLPRPRRGDAHIPGFRVLVPSGGANSMMYLDYGDDYPCALDYIDSYTRTLDINYVAAHAGLFDYLIWAFRPDRNPAYEPWKIDGFLEIAHHVDDTPTLAFIDSFFKLGISPNWTTTRLSTTFLADTPGELSFSIWERFFSRRFERILTFQKAALRIMKILLKFGADPRISISLTKPDECDAETQSDPVNLEIVFNFTRSSKYRLSRKVRNEEKIKTLIGHICPNGKMTTLQEIFEYQVEQNTTDPDIQQLIRGCLVLIERNLQLLDKSPTALEDLPSLLSGDENPSPIPEEDKSPGAPIEEVKVEEKEHLVDQGTGAKNGLQIGQHAEPEEVRKYLGRFWRSSFAPFVLGKIVASLLLLSCEAHSITGLLMTYLYFYFTSTWHGMRYKLPPN
jgi:hypothetical protein